MPFQLVFWDCSPEQLQDPRALGGAQPPSARCKQSGPSKTPCVGTAVILGSMAICESLELSVVNGFFPLTVERDYRSLDYVIS